MKKLFMFLLIGMFMISLSSAWEWDNVKSDYKISKGEDFTIGDKEIVYNDLWETYKPIKVDNAFSLPLIGTTLFSGALTEHTEVCGIDCSSTMEIYLANDGSLIDDIEFKTLQEDNSWITQDVRSYRIYYYNETEWIRYNLKDKIKAGTYKVKIEAKKKPSRTVDWIIKTNGEWLDEWATWGGTIYEQYITGDNGGYDIYDTNTVGQTFTIGAVGAQENHSLESVSVKMYRVGNPGECSINISGQTSGTFNGNSITTDTSGEFVRVYMDSRPELINGTQYRLDIYCPNGNASNKLIARYHDGGTYTGGWIYESGSGRASEDLLFKEYGVEGSVILNSLADNNISNTNEVTFNATAEVITGATLTNMSLWTNESGWSLKENYNISFDKFSDASIDSDLWTSTSSGSASVTEHDGYLDLDDNTWGGATYAQAVTKTLFDDAPFDIVYITIDETSLLKAGNAASGENGYWDVDIGTDAIIDWTATGSSTSYNFHKDTEIQVRYVGSSTFWRINYNYTYASTNYDTEGWTSWTEVSGGSTDELTFKVSSQNTDASGYMFINSIDYFDSITDITTTWNDTIYGSTLWNVQACDSDGDCGFGVSNYTVDLDATAPQLTVETPTSEMGYGKVGDSETLNITFTDINLDSCWYNYNGTNVTIEGCVTGVKNSTTFILEENNLNMTIYANDSVGNENSTFISWEYNLTEISQTYTEEIIELGTNVFTTTLDYNSTKYNVITGILTVNGNTYLGTRTGSGDSAIFTASASMSDVDTETNLSTYWTISLTDASGTVDYNLTTNNVTVSIINLSLCDATNNVPFWNFTVLNESNEAEVNSTFEGTFEVSPVGSSLYSTFSYADTNENKSQYDFCISPSNENYTIDANIKLTKDGYVDKFYDYQEVAVSNSTREDNLYMMVTGDSTSFIVHVVDVSASDIDDAEVRVERYYPGTGEWVVTEILTTNYEGEAVGHFLSEDADYRFKVFLAGVSIYNSTSTKIVCATAPCTVTLVIPIATSEGIEPLESLSSSLTYTDTTNIFTYTYSDTSGEFTSARLYVKRVWPANVTIIVACNETKTSASGVILCDLTGELNGTYRADGYITRSEERLVERLEGILGSNIFNALGLEGVLWGFFVLIAIVMLGISRPSLAIVFGTLGLVFLKVIGIINIGTLSVVAVCAIAIILLTRVGRE